MESKIAGQLKPSKHDIDFFQSEPFSIPYFDNKKLVVGFVEAEHQPYLESADRSLENFLKLNSFDRANDSELVLKYYSETLEYGYAQELSIETPKDVWNFVVPVEIIIHWDEIGDIYLCVSCECDWEEEHSLQLVFKNGQTLTRASGHDGHFND